MKSRLFSLYETIILGKPLLSLLVTLAVIGWLASHIPSFKLDASADSLVLEGDQALKYYREISKRYESEDFLLITYNPEAELLSDQSLQTLDQLRSELAVLDGVSSVVTILDVPLLESPTVSLDEVAGGEIRTLRTPGIDKDMVLAELTNSPLYEDLLTSADGKTTAIQVNLKRDEKYHQLLAERERLRELDAKGSLNSEQAAELERAEDVFRDYSAKANDRQSELVEEVRTIIDRYRDDAQLYLGGVPMIAADMISFIKSDLVIFGAGIVMFIIATLAIIFRRVVWVVLPLATCLLSATFMLGFITWIDWRMTVISSNFVAILLIITLSITIHLVVRYRELVATRPELDQRELVKLTTYYMIKPCIYTALTTIVAFASLVISGIRPVIDFGWMMTLGVAVALSIAFIVLPTTLMLLKKPGGVVLKNEHSATTLQFARITEHFGKAIVLISVLLAVVCVIGISRLEVENRFIDYFHESTEIYQGMEIIDAQLGGTIPLEIIIDPAQEVAEKEFSITDEAKAEANAEEFDELFGEEDVADFSEASVGEGEDEFFSDDFTDDFSNDFGEQTETSYWFNRAGLSRIEEVHDYIDSLDETGKVMSLATPYKVLRRISSGIDDIQLALIQKSLPDNIKEILVDPYLDEDIDQARITVRVLETSHSLRRDELLDRVQDHLVNELGFQKEQVHLTGMLVLYNNMLQSLYKSQILTIGAVFIAIVIMFVILFRSLSIALIAITPNILAAGIVLGGMGLAGIPLDIMTVTIAAITVGIAVDDTIHYVHRFKTEFPKDNNYLATMYRCHDSIGKAMFYTSITIIAGFSILALSNFTPSIYFGLLTGVAMFAALIGALLLLPQLLIMFKPLGPNIDLPREDSVEAEHNRVESEKTV